MKSISKKQAIKNSEISAIKKILLSCDCKCFICKKQVHVDLMHILPKSIFPEHYTNPENLVLGCRECHRKFDDDISFRQKQIKLYNKAKSFDELGANRYFKFN